MAGSARFAAWVGVGLVGMLVVVAAQQASGRESEGFRTRGLLDGSKTAGNQEGVQVVYGPLVTTQATAEASYESYTSIAQCPEGSVVLGCQSRTSGCQYDGSAFRETPTSCVTWNSITFWGVPCPNSTVQAVAFCGKLDESLHKAHYEFKEDIADCSTFPGSKLVACTCAVVYGHNVACAGAFPRGETCVASPDSPLVSPGIVCLEGDIDREIIQVPISDGKGSAQCPAGFYMTDCICAGKGCLKKGIEDGQCTLEVEVDKDGVFGGEAHAICVNLTAPTN